MFQGRVKTLATQKTLGPGDVSQFRAEGRAPCLLAFHGFTGTVSELRPLVERVAARGFAVHAPLLPGHGGRADELQDQTFDMWVGAMRDTLKDEVARHGKVVLCGFSLGSLIALHLAAEGHAGVVGLAVLGNALTLHAYASVPLAVWDRLGLRMPDTYFVKFRVADITDREAEKTITTYDRHPMRAAFEVYRAGKRVRGEVGRIQVPTLILHGKRDRVCRPENAAWLAKHVGARDVTLRVYERSAHVITADVDREDVAREVVAFLERL